MNSKLLLDKIYPVGSIYLSLNSTNPHDLFGGTWQRIAKGRTLVGVDENDNDGDFNTVSKTGGEKKHTLTISEMPSHTHTAGTNSNGFFAHATVGESFSTGFSNTDGEMGWYRQPANTGGGQAHNIMQPYYTCFIFVRTA